MTTKQKAAPLRVPTHHPALSPEAPPELIEDLRRDTPTGERPLDNIHPHPNPTRALDPRHVVDLARSIGVLGLIHPLVVDVEDVVIAGSHRYAALRILATPPPERADLLARLCPAAHLNALTPLADPLLLLAVAPGVLDFMRIPVRVLPLSLAKNPDEAWRAEVAENEQRRDYSAPEVRALAERLKEQGYHYTRNKWAPSEMRMLPVLVALIGKSERHVRRILTTDPAKKIERPSVRSKLQAEAAGALKAMERLKALGKVIGEGDHSTINRALEMLRRLAQS